MRLYPFPPFSIVLSIVTAFAAFGVQQWRLNGPTRDSYSAAARHTTAPVISSSVSGMRLNAGTQHGQL